MPTKSTTAPIPKIEDTRPQALRRLRKLTAEYRDKKTRLERIRSECHLLTYEWITITVAKGDAKNPSEAARRLAQMLKRRPLGIYAYYFTGKFMRDNGLDKHCSGSTTHFIARRHKWLKRHELRQACDMIREGQDHFKVVNYVMTRPEVRRQHESGKAKMLQREGKLNKTRVRLELMTVVPYARRYFKDDHVRVAILDSEGNILEEVS